MPRTFATGAAFARRALAAAVATAATGSLSRGLSGGDILNISLNAIHAGSADADPARWRITQEMLEREIEKARAAKAEHSGKAKKGRRVIGFGG